MCDMMTGTRAAENPVPLAATAQPSPVIVACIPSSPAPPPAGQHCSLGAGGVAGGEETTPQEGAVAVNVNDTCFP